MARDGEQFLGAENRCPHLGWSLAGGKFEAGAVTCPWHHSRYDLRTGENLDWVSSIRRFTMPRWARAVIALGRKPAPLTTCRVLREGDDLWLETR